MEERDITLYGARRASYPKDAFGRLYDNYPSVIAFEWYREEQEQVAFSAIGYASDADFNNHKLPLSELRKSYPVTDVLNFKAANAEAFETIETVAREIIQVDESWQITHFRANAGLREMFIRATKGKTIKTITLTEEDYQAEIDKTNERRAFAFQVIEIGWTYILTSDLGYWGNSTAIE